ncbi:hypothetical protein APHAL10511_007484 [Amanita phalloides]|nr:hypothetical protein APHAL10511_007484 [Amanita phalloides]
MPIKSGNKYRVVNILTNTAMDLSGTDPEHSSIIGWSPHGHENQQWKFGEVAENIYTIKNVRYHDKYVGYAEPLQAGTDAVATGSAIDWEVTEEYETGTYRIGVPGHTLALTLQSREDGTPVQLLFEERHVWKLIPV